MNTRKTIHSLFQVLLSIIFAIAVFLIVLIFLRLGYVLAQKENFFARAFIDFSYKIAIPNFYHMPLKTLYPPNVVKTASDHPDAYFETPQEYIHHTAMEAVPYVMYAPAQGSVLGAFHNFQQFRYQNDIRKKEKNEIRIFITGGSTAWGSMAPNLERTISAYLEKKLNDKSKNGFLYAVINAAAGGFGTTEERIWIQNRITEHEPDLVISYSGHNDIGYITEEKQDIFTYAHNDAGYFFQAIQEFDSFNRNSPFPIFQKENSKKFFSENDFPRKIIKNIQITASYLNFLDVPYIFVLQPINKTSPYAKDYLRQYETLSEELEKKKNTSGAKFTFINHTNLFEGEEKYFVDLVHFGDRGYEIIAERLSKNLEGMLNYIEKKRK